MHIDPIFIIASALAIAVLLASAATHKLRAPARFARQLADYQLLPEALTRPGARVIPLLELVIAFALLVPANRNSLPLMVSRYTVRDDSSKPRFRPNAGHAPWLPRLPCEACS